MFCDSRDADDYFCKRRQPAPSDSHKYAILDAYCNINPLEGGPAAKDTETCKALAAIVKKPVALTFQHKKGEWLDNGKLFKVAGVRGPASTGRPPIRVLRTLPCCPFPFGDPTR